MKPIKIFLVFLGLLILISVIAYIFPENGIKISEDIRLNFPSYSEIIKQNQTEYKDISDIVQNNLPADTVAPQIDTTTKDKEIGVKDTIPDQEKEKKIQKTDTIQQQTNQTKKASPTEGPLQYPNEDKTILYPFFKSLNRLEDKENELIRILHYGDSQIEGDRISSYLRDQLQKKFGGAGLGLFPVSLPFNTPIPLKHNISRQWKRYTLKDKSNFQHRKFGILMSFSRFSPYYSHYQNEVYDAYINLQESPISYDLVSKFSQIRIFYGFNEKPFITKLEYGGEVVDAEMMTSTRSLKEIKWDLPPEIKELTISFQGVHSPNIYGIALDDTKGIALDNIPLRGSRGTDFTKTDTLFYKNMLDKLNVKLIIMHFGVNIVPLIRENYDFYENKFYNQLATLKSLDEDLSIIVMGVSDMSKKAGGVYESYPNIEKIRNAQKSAAFKADCVFWDTYLAMGGKNSMPSWVFADPPLARKDFTHFTYKGSVVIAKMFYKALINDYLEYHQQDTIQMLSKNGKIHE